MTSTETAGAPTKTVLDWVSRYGIATVFAVILLLFVLWSNYTQAQQQALSIQQTSELVKDQTRVLDQMTRTLADVSLKQQQTAQTLDRISMRLEGLPPVRGGGQ